MISFTGTVSTAQTASRSGGLLMSTGSTRGTTKGHPRIITLNTLAERERYWKNNMRGKSSEVSAGESESAKTKAFSRDSLRGKSRWITGCWSY